MRDPLDLTDLENGILTEVYGPPGLGKTTYCLLAAKSVRRKTIFIDTEGLSGARIQQLGQMDMLILRPQDFNQLHSTILSLRSIKAGLVVVDSLAMLYRLELMKDPHKANDALTLQLHALMSLARRSRIPVILTNHSYTPFGGGEAQPVGGDILDYRCKCIIELKRDGENRVAILRKHRSQAETSRPYRIDEKGFVSVTAVTPMDSDSRKFV